MSRVSGGAVLSNRPRTDLARALAEQLAGATLPSAKFTEHTRHQVRPVYQWDSTLPQALDNPAMAG